MCPGLKIICHLTGEGDDALVGELPAVEQAHRVELGDTVILTSVNEELDLQDIRPVSERFVVVGFFETGMYEFDSGLALIDLADAQKLYRVDGVSGVRLKLDDLFAAYPDASVIVSHRDPAKTMPSTVSTTAMVQWLRTDDVPVDLLAELIGAVFTDALNALARRRDDQSLPDAFGDVRFADLMADPVAAVAAAYAQIGREMTDDHRQSVVAYLEAKPRGKHGTHAYTAADWGFDVATTRAELAPYVDRFAIPFEA